MLFALNTFFGAWLLFVVQPMFAKWLLPVVGGSPATWAACMVFYQTLLLAGYAYAHLLTTRLSRGAQVRLHVVLVVVAAVALLRESAASPELAPVDPAFAIPWLLLRELGFPFFVLASTAPLLQRWAAFVTGRSPYSLYALSNAGSLLGLLSYPFLLEPAFDLSEQRAGFRWAFAAFCGLMVWAALRLHQADEAPHEPESAPSPSGQRTPEAAQWMAWAFVPSVLLLAATNHITVDVAATPLLWVAPLALYLVSFIVAFGAWRSAWRGPLLVVWLVAATGLALNSYAQAAAPLWRQLGATLLALFAACTLCHGELARTRPPVRQLTRYYLYIASGGALGGAFVSWVAPVVFNDYFELELAALATFGLLLFASRPSQPDPWPRTQRLGVVFGAAIGVPLLVANLWLRTRPETRQGRVFERTRSFSGTLRVLDLPTGRLLTHGRIQHGFQLRGDVERRLPTLCFGPGTALARVFEAHHPERPRSIGVVGLGIGTIASYGRPGDQLRFYELDDQVVGIARRDFTFLSDSQGSIEIVIGDGRLALAREAPHAFDLLVLDAFTSDAVPVHLLTREAFAVYAAQLAPDGVLLAHISNRYLAIDRVVRASANALNLAHAIVENPPDPGQHVTRADWALLARDPSAVEVLARPLQIKRPTGPDLLWTDAHASVFSAMRSAARRRSTTE